MACAMGVHLGKKYGCRKVGEVADLWPESIVAFGIAGPHNPAVIALRWLEKWIYTHSDAMIFTMEGAYDYIVEQGWEKDIPRSKVYHINNGVDLEKFDHDRDTYRWEDPDLEDPSTFKVIYTGSIRQANGLGQIVDAAKALTDPKIKLLIWGGGDDVPALEQRVRDEGLTNIVFKGKVDKKYIPSIVSRADMTLVHWQMNTILKYGISYNKLFEYMAAGHPVFSTIQTPYSIVERYDCGAETAGFTAGDFAAGIERLANLPPEEQTRLGVNARKAAEEYDFHKLTEKLLRILEAKG
jgi:glycosyltransferase involved in cell wall biosynthesis